MKRTLVSCALVLGGLFGLAAPARAGVPGDFNGDGFADLAIGVPCDPVSSQYCAGAVNVLYGSASGLTSAGNQLWHRDSPGILGAAVANALFGRALATGQ